MGTAVGVGVADGLAGVVGVGDGLPSWLRMADGIAVPDTKGADELCAEHAVRASATQRTRRTPIRRRRSRLLMVRSPPRKLSSVWWALDRAKCRHVA
jgi:hypothetical protein